MQNTYVLDYPQGRLAKLHMEEFRWALEDDFWFFSDHAVLGESIIESTKKLAALGFRYHSKGKSVDLWTPPRGWVRAVYISLHNRKFNINSFGWDPHDNKIFTQTYVGGFEPVHALVFHRSLRTI